MQLLSLNNWHQNLTSSDQKKGIWEVEYIVHSIKAEISIMGKEGIKKVSDY